MRNQLLDRQGVPLLVQKVAVSPVELRIWFFDGLEVRLPEELASDLSGFELPFLSALPPDLLHRYLETVALPVWKHYRQKWSPPHTKALDRPTD